MLDFENLQQYRENNRIEAKKAQGGLPHSIWETYSAFANTYGGLILLGVEELPDKALHAVNLPDPQRLVTEFWELVNDPGKTSVNILSAKDVFIREVDGSRIVVIHVPRAERTDRPVYVQGDPKHTYRRNGEGDYRCTQEEYQAMVRDAAVQSQDQRLLSQLDLSALHGPSVAGYRQRMRLCRPGHGWETLEDGEFLQKLGAAGIGADGKRHPTVAGLLMFGHGQQILAQFGAYCLDYRQYGPHMGQTQRIHSSSDDWSGNVYDFFFRVYHQLIQDLPISAETKNGTGAEDPALCDALREALVNCLVHADYAGRQGVTIVKTEDRITLTNPGSFRIGIDAAKKGGLSDPRNGTLQAMFRLIDLGEGASGGIPGILHVWRERGWAMPTVQERLEPASTTLTLTFAKAGDQSQREKPRDPGIYSRQRQSVIGFLTRAVRADCRTVAQLLGVSPSRARRILTRMMEEGIVVAEGGNRNRTYRLKY